MKIEFTLNGRGKSLDADPLRRLLDYLREEEGLTAVKEGCGEGECGACSVLMNGKLVNSCMILLSQVQNREILTPEGLKDTRQGEALTEGFAEAGAVQCGFCTPGMMMAAHALLLRNPRPSEEEIRRALSGNLCRCTGYNMIVDGVRRAVEKGDDLW